MPIKIEYTKDGLGVKFIAYGITTGKEIIQANKEVSNSEKFSSLRYKVADRSECDEYLVSGEDVKIIAEQERESSQLNPGLVVALIARNEIQFGMSRMYHALMADQGFECEIFRSQENAIKWIYDRIEKSDQGDIGK